MTFHESHDLKIFLSMCSPCVPSLVTFFPFSAHVFFGKSGYLVCPRALMYFSFRRCWVHPWCWRSPIVRTSPIMFSARLAQVDFFAVKVCLNYSDGAQFGSGRALSIPLLPAGVQIRWCECALHGQEDVYQKGALGETLSGSVCQFSVEHLYSLETGK